MTWTECQKEIDKIIKENIDKEILPDLIASFIHEHWGLEKDKNKNYSSEIPKINWYNFHLGYILEHLPTKKWELIYIRIILRIVIFLFTLH